MGRDEFSEHSAFDELERYQRETEDYIEDRKIKKARNKKIRRTRDKKIFTLGVLTGVCGSLMASAIAVHARLFVATEKIANNYYVTVLDDFGYTNQSDGYHFNIGPRNVDSNTAVNVIKTRSNAEGFSDVETYIALNCIFNETIAKEVAGRVPDRDEIVAFKLEKLAKNLDKGDEERAR